MTAFYLTTTLPYVNAQPHIGHALEFIQADVIARRRRQQGDEVIFNVGTDEHGLKIYQKAAEVGMDVHDFVDANAQTFADFFAQFGISYTNFYRTSAPSHTPVAQGMRARCQAAGDIYKKSYSGLYCVGCESFKTPKDLVDEQCPLHHTKPIVYEEENYFFRLSKYIPDLISYYNSHEALLPTHKLPELLNFIEQMEDISISRSKKSLPRGVPVPDDDEQVMYVWFDALSNYIGAVGFPTDEKKIATYRPGIQLFGPDNLRFQCAIRQGMLLSAGYDCTKTFLMHGMILGPDGNKMSKTLGNVISPMDQLEKYGAEAVRLYMIAGIPTFADASYKEDDLVNLYNSRLANTLGNLLSRVITLANKKEISLQDITPSPLIAQKIAEANRDVYNAYDQYELYDAAQLIHELGLWANKYLDDHKPREKETTQEVTQRVLVDLGALLETLITLYTPIIPESCIQAREMLKKQEKAILFTKKDI